MKTAIPWAFARLAILSLATALSGCAWAKYHPYEGGQQNWPTAPGAFVDRNAAIPVYHGPPSRPYSVIGYIDATTAPIRRGGVVAFAARRAKENGADAIVVLQEGSEYAGTVSIGSASTTANYYGNYTGRTNVAGSGQYRGNGLTTYSGTANQTGAYRGFGSASSFGSATSFAAFRGKAQVLAIKWR